ncbi:Transcription initiation factor TFIID subunit 13 [Coelomomyces lativittatus]|nr:Transcription initiation factor TFIID subunit 13 [Coelomomyces lativittatus]KAJ1514610.1 Transcription initiation factor TFIID subunit 13 [Coelomomyces lativittatus]KAJ1517365.1 Transcription initiation factor TFIID subunit 13 [Coelomomyces lativittatus]
MSEFFKEQPDHLNLTSHSIPLKRLGGGMSELKEKDKEKDQDKEKEKNKASLSSVVDRFKGSFTNELKQLLWAHGDPNEHNPETVSLLENILIEFMCETCMQAHRLSGFRSRLKIDDFRFLFRHDPLQLGRLEEILKKEEKIRKARNLLDQDFSDFVKFGELSDQEEEQNVKESL